MGHYKRSMQRAISEAGTREYVEGTEFDGRNRASRRHGRTHTGKVVHFVNPQSHSRMLGKRFSESKWERYLASKAREQLADVAAQQEAGA